jgi:hypothetical protein
MAVDGQEKVREAAAGGRQRLLPGLSVKDGYTRHPFDLQYGVRTSGLVSGRHLKSGHPHDRHNTAYYGVAPSVLQALIARWRRCPQQAPLDAYTFVDLGAGMGRAVLLASEYPFRAALGVELHPTLAGIARKNLRLWRSAGREKAPMRILGSDVLDFTFPAGPCVAFLFNPFQAPVMRKLLKALAREFAQRPGMLDLLYVNHEQEHLLEMQKGFTRLFLGQVRRSREDAIADYRILANQPDGEYASSNAEECSVWRWMGN